MPDASTFQPDTEARDTSRLLSIISMKARESAAYGMMARDGAVALKALATAASALANHTGDICHSSKSGAGNLHALAALLHDIGGDLTGYYLEPEQTAHDLAAIRADERAKAMREDAA